MNELGIRKAEIMAMRTMLLGLATFAAGCGSLAPRASGAAPNTSLAAYTIVGEPGEACTTTPATSGNESFLLDLFAPFVIELAKGAFDAIGTAIQGASEAKTKDKPTNAASLYIAKAEYQAAGTPGGPTVPQYSVKYFSRCIHAVVVDEDRGAAVIPGTAAIARIDVTDRAKIPAAILASVQPKLPATVRKIRFYAALEMQLDQTSAFKQVYYKVRPAIIYYGEPVAGRDFKLGALKLQLDSAWDPGKTGWSYSLLLADNPMIPGDLRIDPVPEGSLLAAPALSPEDVKGIQAIRDPIAKLSTAGDTAAAVASFNARSATLAADQLANANKKCELDNTGKPAAIDLCKNSAKAANDAAVLTKEKTDAVDNNALLKQVIALANPPTRVGLGPYNASVTFTETRDANAFGLAVAKALKDSKTARDTAITNYANTQLGVTPDPSTLAADSAYRLSRYDYDQAVLAYEKAKTGGDAADMATKLRALIVAYNDLLAKAEAAKQQVTLPAPY